MSDAEQDRMVAAAHEKVATNNARAAITIATEVKDMTEERIKRLEGLVSNLEFQITHLHQKYNLLLTKQFNGGSTVHEDE